MRKIRVRRWAGYLIIASGFAPILASASVADDIGYTKLAAELGELTPDGSGVEVIQVEATSGAETGAIAYAPDPENAEFAGKKIVDASGKSTQPSGHATSVGKIFFGNETSLASGIENVQSFLSLDWFTAGFLAPTPVIGQLRPQPAMTSARIGNHSFVGSFSEANTELLQRLDWLIETDEFIQVVGFNGGKTPIASGAFNVIAVDTTLAARSVGTAPVDELYTGDRPRPHLVVPEANPSRATPWVAAAAAILVETAHENTGLSNDPVRESARNRSGKLVYNAERSEVIKAALMAGAERETSNSVDAQIALYRGSGADRTANGLDRRYGAGQLNILNSYRIITAGEQNSDEDRSLLKGWIQSHGFDYDPQFGGAFDSNPRATYFIKSSDKPRWLAASLVWNIDIDGGIENIFIGAPTLHDLNLTLYDVSDDDNWKKTARSESSADNTENIWVTLKADTEYALQVDGVGAFRHDYALAWRFTN